MIFIIIWILTIIVSFLMLRKAIKIADGDAFGDFELFGFIWSIILCLIPCLNIIFSVLFLLIHLHNNSSFDVEDLARKIFGIKDE